MKTGLLAAVLLCACTSQKGEPGEAGPRGEAGAAGVQGPAGPKGSDGAAIAGARIVVWVDANGAVIGPEPLYVDDAGVQWILNRETGHVDLGRPLTLRFEDPDCTGQALVAPPATRIAFAIAPTFGYDIDAGAVVRQFDGGVFVRPDDTLRAESRNAQFNSESGSCQDLGGGIVAVPVSALRNAAIPQSPFTGPLHSEWR